MVLIWAMARRVRRGSISLELLMCGVGVRSILLLSLVAKCLQTIDVCIWRMFGFMSVVVTVWGSVGDFIIVCRPLLKFVFFYSLGVLLYVCVRVLMDVVFSVCIVTRGAVGDRVWEV